MSENDSYILLLSQKRKSLKPLKEKFEKLGGFYNGIGYAFQKKQETALKKIVEGLDLKIIPQPLSQGNSFESFRISHKKIYYRDKLLSAQSELRSQMKLFEIEEATEEAIKNSNIEEHSKEKILEALDEVERLREAMEWAGKMADTLASQDKVTPKLRFISEISPDYFSKCPPEKPPLLYFFKDGDISGKKIPFLHKEITAMLVAEGGRGKTHLCANLAASVASGVPFLGKFHVAERGAVCFIVGENDQKDVHRLLFKTRQQIEETIQENEKMKEYEKFPTYNDSLDKISSSLCPLSVHGLNASLISSKGSKTPFFDSLLEQLINNEPEDGWQLIIFDPVSRFSGPEAEKDNAIATHFIAALESISSSLRGKPTIFLSHHKSKASINNSAEQQAARGASALTDGARWQANLGRVENQDTFSLFTVTKTNFTPPIQEFTIEKRFDGVPIFGKWGKR